MRHYYKGERIGEARALNMIANDRKPISQQQPNNNQEA